MFTYHWGGMRAFSTVWCSSTLWCSLIKQDKATDTSVYNNLQIMFKNWCWSVYSFFAFHPPLPFNLFTCLSCHKVGGLAANPRDKLFTLWRTSGGLSWCYRFLWSLCYPFEHTLSSHLCTCLQMEQHTGAALKWIRNRKVPESLVKHT